MNTTTKTVLTVAAALLISYSPVSLTAAALAYDDDVEFVCGDTDDGGSYCVSVEDLKAECPLSDPEGVGEECAGLEENRPSRNILGGFGVFKR